MKGTPHAAQTSLETTHPYLRHLLGAVRCCADFPFYIISIALSTILMLSILVVALAWAYTHDY